MVTDKSSTFFRTIIRQNSNRPSRLRTSRVCLVLWIVMLAIWRQCEGLLHYDLPQFNQNELPVTSFSCVDKTIGVYYADYETQCQMFHICVKTPGFGVQNFRFLCPNYTLFDQESQICDDWYNIDCDAASLYQNNNFDLYKIGANIPVKVTEHNSKKITALPTLSKHETLHSPTNDRRNKYQDINDIDDETLRGSDSGNFFSGKLENTRYNTINDIKTNSNNKSNANDDVNNSYFASNSVKNPIARNVTRIVKNRQPITTTASSRSNWQRTKDQSDDVKTGNGNHLYSHTDNSARTNNDRGRHNYHYQQQQQQQQNNRNNDRNNVNLDNNQLTLSKSNDINYDNGQPHYYSTSDNDRTQKFVYHPTTPIKQYSSTTTAATTTTTRQAIPYNDERSTNTRYFLNTNAQFRQPATLPSNSIQYETANNEVNEENNPYIIKVTTIDQVTATKQNTPRIVTSITTAATTTAEESPSKRTNIYFNIKPTVDNGNSNDASKQREIEYKTINRDVFKTNNFNQKFLTDATSTSVPPQILSSTSKTSIFDLEVNNSTTSFAQLWYTYPSTTRFDRVSFAAVNNNNNNNNNNRNNKDQKTQQQNAKGTDLNKNSTQKRTGQKEEYDYAYYDDAVADYGFAAEGLAAVGNPDITKTVKSNIN